MDRVKFFSTSDASSGYYLKKAEEVISNFNSLRTNYAIDDILELHNIQEYFDKGVYLNNWTQEYIEKCRACVRNFQSVIGRYLKQISNENIIREYLGLDIMFRDDFWKVFVKYKVYEGISSETMENILNLNEVSLSSLLSHKLIVNRYGKELENELLRNSGSAKIILDKYEMYHNRRVSDIFLPVELTLIEKETIILNYIDLPEAHINILEIIQNMKNTKDFNVSDRTRLKAKKRIETEKEKILNENTGMKMETYVSFSKEQNEYRIIDQQNLNWHFSYSSNWIFENRDYATLLNNFICLFEYVDMQTRVTFVNKNSNMGIFERLQMRSQNDYPLNIVFQRMNMLALLQITAYYQELKINEIQLENIIEWFFKEYLRLEFSITNFSIRLPSNSLTYLEKSRTIFPELESVLRQYQLLIEDGEINKELLTISSSSMDYDSLSSIIRTKKYVYGTGDNFQIAKNYLTSDQCMLAFIERIGEKYDCFYDLLCNEQIYIDDYIDYCFDDIEWLRVHNIVIVTKDGMISWKNRTVVDILVDLSNNDVICFWHYPKNYRDVIDWLHSEGMVEFECKLLTKPERDYISYLLNKSKFGNGFDIRNKCLHGTQADSESGENIHERYYMYALMVFIICIIKINDELCIYNSPEYQLFII